MGMWVFGAEADIQWRNHVATTPTFVFIGAGDQLTLTDNQKWFGTVRGRVGLTPFASNWLFYVTGGLAYGKFDHTVVQFFNNGGGSVTQTTSISRTKAGWALGAGVEYALDQRWSLGAEYLYMDFGKDTVDALTPVTGGASSTTFKDVSQVARVKLNYKFLP
jgi:outer membrane immunogenic protein